jgi:4-hydroxybenzoate polyprenyltransferase
LRPFASGRLPIQSGLLASPALLVSALTLALWQLPWAFTAGLVTYYAMTLEYSLALKRRMVIDVIVLAGLYTLRIIVGAIAVSISLSFWLLAFSMFLFLSLALVKRYAELFQARAQGKEKKAGGRGYFPSDLQMLASLGAASGYMAVMVLALYVNDPQTARQYSHHQIIWLACPLLLTWISRVWMLAHRGAMNEDPVIFAVRDRISLTIGLLMALVFWQAT